MSKYRRIRYEDRCQIYALSDSRGQPGKHRAHFGCQSKRLSREMRRNRGQRGYRLTGVLLAQKKIPHLTVMT